MTAPLKRPEVNRRCKKAKNTRLGTVANTDAAASGPNWTWPSAPTKRASTSGSVLSSGSCNRTRAKKNSFHAEMKVNIAVAISPGRVQVNGPLGELSQDVPARMKIEQEDGQIVVARPTERGEDRALHGLTRTLVANMVEGVTKGFEKRLEIQGVGYRASMRGTSLELNVGYSHPVVKDAPQGITFEVPAATEVVVKGTDKQQVGHTSAEVRAVRPPEPYKGKGIRYRDEVVRRKVGKRA